MYQASSSEMFGAAPSPQNELTRFHPRSPYAAAKVYAYWITVNYRESYGLFGCNGILFNHESPRRGETFVTRKITRALAAILAGRQRTLHLGNLDAKRDWGFHAPNYADCQWKILQQERPDDFVIGTGEARSVRGFVEEAFGDAGVELEWRARGRTPSASCAPSTRSGSPRRPASASAARSCTYERLAPAGPELVPCMKIKGMDSADLQRRLPPGTALVQYIPTRRALYAFVVTSAGRSLELAAVDRERLMLTLRELAGEFRRYEAGSDSVKMELQGSDVRLKQLLHTASEWFIRPIMREFASGSTLIVVAMPDFAWLPLHAMPFRTASRSRYLAELVPVTYTPLVQSVRAPLRVGPVRDVVSMGFAGRTLWDVEYELRDIRAFYKDARLYFTRQATLATLEAERADLLHLASPMIVDAHEPANSCIVLSDGKSLTTSRNVLLGELLSLPVYSGVVLSNLSPGATALHAGIPYVVLATGTGTVVMNAYVPWRTAKKYFSEVFYTSLLSGVTSEGAFRKVQLEMIKAPDYASPLVWAPFFLWRR